MLSVVPSPNPDPAQPLSPLVMGAVTLAKAMMAVNHPHTVYIVAANEEFCKIGFTGSSTAQRRIEEIQNHCPYELRLILETSGGRPLEQALHTIFAPFNHRGEWFRLEGDLLDFCREIAKLKAT
jgi:hypothetical protein